MTEIYNFNLLTVKGKKHSLMPMFYIVEFDCRQDYVLIFAEHTTKYPGIITIFNFVVYIENNLHIL